MVALDYCQITYEGPELLKAIQGISPADLWRPLEIEAFLKGGNLHAHLLKLAALDRGCTVDVIGHKLLLVTSASGKTTSYSGRTLPSMGVLAHRLAANKIASGKLLKLAGLQTPQSRLFSSRQITPALKHFRDLGAPAVIKPLKGSGGIGVTVNICDEDHFHEGWQAAMTAPDRDIIVEKFIRGRDYRVFVVGDDVVAAARRHPASIVGDGAHTVQELLDIKSADRATIPYVGGKPLVLTTGMLRKLREAGRGPDFVLAPGTKWQLHEVANIGAGGDSEDVTDCIHPDFVKIALAARRAIPGMGYAGVDILAEDISAPQAEQDWAICEINSSPEFALHHFPVIGTGRDVAGKLIEHALGENLAKDKADIASVKAVISGKVTGVGYRSWLQREALAHNIEGWVRNLPNENVECVLQGPRGTVTALLKACKKGPRAAKPQSVTVSSAQPVTLTGFKIIE